MTKTFDWTSNKYDTIHTLRVWDGSKLIAKVPNLNGATLHECVKSLKAEGYTHKEVIK